MRFRLSSDLALNYVNRGGGRPIVLLHPVGLDHRVWGPAMAELEKDFRAIAVDMRGHGDSDHDGKPITLESLADDIAELIRGVCGGEKAIVAGCSMGGMVAQGVGVRAPELLTGIVVANTAHLRNDQGRQMMEQRAVAAAQGMPSVLETTLKRWFDEAYLREAPDVVATVRGWLLAGDPMIHAASWRAIRDLNFADKLSSLQVPAMALAGTRDQATPIEAMHQMAAVFPKGRYHEIDAGHLTPLERPKAFADAIRSFASSF